jgi:hypothetical protein
MTLTALVTLNAVLGAAVAGGLVYLLGHGVLRDHEQRLRRAVELAALSRADSERLAA